MHDACLSSGDQATGWKVLPTAGIDSSEPPVRPPLQCLGADIVGDFLRQYQLNRPEPIKMERQLFNTVK